MREIDRSLSIFAETAQIPSPGKLGKQEAARSGIANVTCLAGRAEDLELAPTSVDLIAIGEAFHRLDPGPVRERICAGRSAEEIDCGNSAGHERAMGMLTDLQVIAAEQGHQEEFSRRLTAMRTQDYRDWRSCNSPPARASSATECDASPRLLSVRHPTMPRPSAR